MDIRDLIRQALPPLTVSVESETIQVAGRAELDQLEDMLETDDELLSEIDDSVDDAKDVTESEAVVDVIDGASVNTAELGDVLAKTVAEGGVSAESLTMYNTALESLIRAHRLPIATEDFQVSVEDYGTSKTRVQCSMEALDKAVELFKRFWEGLKRVIKEFIQKVVNFVRSFKEVGQKIRKAGVALQDGIKTLDNKTAPAALNKSAGAPWTRSLVTGSGLLRNAKILTPAQAIEALNKGLKGAVIDYPQAVFNTIAPVMRALQQKKPFIEIEKISSSLKLDYTGRVFFELPGCSAVIIGDRKGKTIPPEGLAELAGQAAFISRGEDMRITADVPVLTKQDLMVLARDLIKTGESIATLERETRDFDKIVNEFMKAGDVYTKEAVEGGWAKGDVKTLLSQLRQCITHQASFMAVYLPYMAGICRNLYQYGTYSIAAYR